MSPKLESDQAVAQALLQILSQRVTSQSTIAALHHHHYLSEIRLLYHADMEKQ